MRVVTAMRAKPHLTAVRYRWPDDRYDMRYDLKRRPNRCLYFLSVNRFTYKAYYCVVLYEVNIFTTSPVPVASRIQLRFTCVYRVQDYIELTAVPFDVQLYKFSVVAFV